MAKKKPKGKTEVKKPRKKSNHCRECNGTGERGSGYYVYVCSVLWWYWEKVEVR